MKEPIDYWMEKHSVNCYFCGVLVDERECYDANVWNNNDGGGICEDCQIHKEAEQLKKKGVVNNV